jgi:hypothetical protein
MLYPSAVSILWKKDRLTSQSKGRCAVDVTLLFINSSYGVHTLLPSSPDDRNRLGPGQQTDNTLRFAVVPPYGTDHPVAIAVKAQPSTSPLLCVC